MDYAEFKSIIYANYETAGRTFPWRTNLSPWGVLVSEFMLQQTQTERVIPFWERWMKLWPSPGSLAEVPTSEVLREWSGLGYNRRGLFLKDCAGLIVKNYGGRVPETPEALASLPGIGPYTSGAIACFAYNYPAVFIETNIRSVALHFFFKDRKDVKDKEIFPILKNSLDQENPRKWHWALMDYGAVLKKLTVNPNRRSAHYTRQSPFEGSFRQMRGAVIKTLVSQGPGSTDEIKRRTGIMKKDLYKVLGALEKESMVAEDAGLYKIKD
ncbi:MAG: A/G-specific adenine glycosylase [Treponema sp.]|jgi:A/G-specific adenine glycosylase|nr:A/G-specific adenine glycosylase [Treponema sp.]